MANSEPAGPLALTVTLDASVSADVEPLVLALFDEHRRPLVRYVISLGLPAQDAEDVVQDVFVALFRHLRRGGPRHHLTAWLFQVAHNLGIRHRHRGARRSWLLRLAIPAGPGSGAGVVPSPEIQLAESERQERWRRILQALPERDRQCVLLRAEGLTYRGIARELNVSLGTVAKSMARALARFTRADEVAR